MALAKQTLVLILISACIIFPTCMNADRILTQSKPDKPSHKHSKPHKPSKPDKPSKPGKPSHLPAANAKCPPPPNGKAEVANMVAKQMQGVQKKIDEFNASLKKRLNHHKSSHRIRECVSECDEVFGAAIADIKKTFDSLKSLNLMKANFDVSAVATNVDTCNDCFDEIGCGGDAEVKKLGEWVRKITGDALAALQTAA